MVKPNDDELLSCSQTAQLLGCSEDHVRRLHTAGKLVGVDISLSGRRACWRWRLPSSKHS